MSLFRFFSIFAYVCPWQNIAKFFLWTDFNVWGRKRSARARTSTSRRDFLNPLSRTRDKLEKPHFEYKHIKFFFQYRGKKFFVDFEIMVGNDRVEDGEQKCPQSTYMKVASIHSKNRVFSKSWSFLGILPMNWYN